MLLDFQYMHKCSNIETLRIVADSNIIMPYYLYTPLILGPEYRSSSFAWREREREREKD